MFRHRSKRRHFNRPPHRFNCVDEGPDETAPRGTVPLTMMPCDENARLVAIRGGHTIRRRLAELGLNQGSLLRVMQNSFGGPIILAVKEDTRIAIGRGMAYHILVTPLTNQDYTSEEP